MNAEVIKAMNKKPEVETTFKKVCKWWRNNDYKVYRVILFPIWFGVLTKERFDRWVISRNKWSEARADEILSYYVPRYANWHAKEKEFYFFDNGNGWYYKLANKHLKRKDRTFWKTNTGWSGGHIRQYLIKDFELEGFKKEVGECSDGWTEITFKLIEK